MFMAGKKIAGKNSGNSKGLLQPNSSSMKDDGSYSDRDNRSTQISLVMEYKHKMRRSLELKLVKVY